VVSPEPEIAVKEDAITTIAKLLQGCEDNLTALRVKSLRQGTMGHDGIGVQCVQETELAREALGEIVTEMIGVIQGLEVDLRKFEGDVRYADDDAQTRAHNLLVKLGAI